jgi:translocation and assembly module TamA
MCLVVALAAAVIAFDARDGARVFDFFGLWGSDESPPPVSRTAISYAVTIDIEGGAGALKNSVTDASSFYRLRKDPPPDGDALARRAESDFGPIIGSRDARLGHDVAILPAAAEGQARQPLCRAGPI